MGLLREYQSFGASDCEAARAVIDHPAIQRLAFGEYIRKARLEKGLRQMDVARAIGVSEMTIANWERYPTVPMRHHRKVRRLCEFLGIAWAEMKRRFPHTGTALSSM